MSTVGYINSFVHNLFSFFTGTEFLGLPLATWALGFIFLSAIIAVVRGVR